MKTKFIATLILSQALSLSFANAGGGSQGPTTGGDGWLQINHAVKEELLKNVTKKCTQEILEAHVSGIDPEAKKSTYPTGYLYSTKKLTNISRLDKEAICWESINTHADHSQLYDYDKYKIMVNSLISPNMSSESYGYSMLIAAYPSQANVDKSISFCYTMRNTDNDYYALQSGSIPSFTYEHVPTTYVHDPVTGKPIPSDRVVDHIQITHRDGPTISFFNTQALDLYSQNKINQIQPVFSYPRERYIQCLESGLMEDN